jgi:hypothetical protein
MAIGLLRSPTHVIQMNPKGLPHLKSLALSGCNIVVFPPCGENTLHTIRLGQCGHVDFDSFVRLVQQNSASIQVINMSGVLFEDSETTHIFTFNPAALRNLKYLTVIREWRESNVNALIERLPTTVIDVEVIVYVHPTECLAFLRDKATLALERFRVDRSWMKKEESVDWARVKDQASDTGIKFEVMYDESDSDDDSSDDSTGASAYE